MTNKLQFKYFLSDKKNPVQKNSKLWTTPLPMNRKQPLKASGISVSYGDYFAAVHSFLKKDGIETIVLAASQCLNSHTKSEIKPEEIEPDKIEEICIYLEKHGEFYHPARIEIIAHELKFNCVLNVAISNAGKGCIEREYSCLKKLNTDFPFLFIPKVYGCGEVRIKESGLKISMFLGEWFEGFGEFHISHDRTSRENRIIVWDHEQGNFFLSPDQTIELYRQAAMILTCYYNVETSEQIFPWHHAAGDFVVRLQNNKMELKLITVRNYTSPFKASPFKGKNINENKIENKGIDPDLVLQAMLLFFLNLSIRMRLDRVDGIGDIVWADDIAVEGTVKGFFQGLTRKPPIVSIQESLAICFQQYFSLYTESVLYDLLRAIVNMYNPSTPEIHVIKRNLKNHAHILHNIIRGKRSQALHMNVFRATNIANL